MIYRNIRRHIKRFAAAAAKLPALLLGAPGGRAQLRYAEVKAKSRLNRRQGAGKWATD